MTSQNVTVTVFGGTGFVGRQIVRILARRGWTVRVATRVPERAYFLRPCGNVGQVVPFACDSGNAESVARALRGADYAVNCIGILFERGKRQRFARTHIDIPAVIAAACARENVQRFVHISSLGINGNSRYAQTKREGEKAVQSNFPRATIFRPSVIFGPDDHFFNLFAELSRYAPCLPLIGGGTTKFQPVYVGDVGTAVERALILPTGGADDPRGRTYALGGPEVLSFRDIYQRIFDLTGRTRNLTPVPYALAKTQAWFMEFLPKPLLTRDQVESLKSDSVVPPDALTLNNLGVTPTAPDAVLPGYLTPYRAGGRFGKTAA